MIDLSQVSKQAVYWPLKEMVNEITKLQVLVLTQHEQIEKLTQKVEHLENTKADRKGRKKSELPKD